MKTMPTDKIEPYELSAPDRYSRLFQPTSSAIAATDSRLECLAWSMYDKDVQGQGPARSLLPAAYTYFGQFVDHDMTFEGPSVGADGCPREPRDIPNLRRNWLNLDSLYGDGPGTVAEGIYAADSASFEIAEVTVNNRGSKTVVDRRGVAFDLPLDATHNPLSADPRNIENAILRQLHAMFLKLHNKAVHDMSASFSEARLRVCHQYQWLVRNDFLCKISDPTIYESIMLQPMYDWQGQFSIPVEFARAAFRFGHSIVRESYGLGPDNAAVSLCSLFGGQNSVGALPSSHAVPWSRFLNPGKETSRFINTSVVPPLFDIPHPSARLFKTSPLPDMVTRHARVSPCGNAGLVLPHVTLQRGATARLPSGQFVHDHLFGTQQPLQFDGRNYDPYADLKNCRLEEEIPLWYYVLLEAEGIGKGLRLGPVGSRIVGEVIEGALWANQQSYLNIHGPSWEPCPWDFEGGKWPIRTLRDVAVVAGLVTP